jgi:hypothetical protein
LEAERFLPDEDMVDYFDAKVDLQAFVFDDHTPDSELILDLLDGLPSHMLPTLKASIAPDTTLLEFRRTLLDYEKGLRWEGAEEWSDNTCSDDDCDDTVNEADHSHHRDHDDGDDDTYNDNNTDTADSDLDD